MNTPLSDDVLMEFVSEIREDLARLEPDLLNMEAAGASVDSELINHAFRAIHSIKGGAGFIQFQELSQLAHTMENVLTLLREKTASPNPAITDALLAGLDRMKSLVNREPGSGAGEESVDRELEMLEAVLSLTRAPLEPRNPEPCGDQTPGASDGIVTLRPLEPLPGFGRRGFPVAGDRLHRALDKKRFIYGVHIPCSSDSDEPVQDVTALARDIECMGELLYPENPARNLVRGNSPYLVVATLLDKPLVARVLGVAVSQVALLDQQFMDPDALLSLWDGQGGSQTVSPGDQGDSSSFTETPVLDSLSEASLSQGLPPKESQYQDPPFNGAGPIESPATVSFKSPTVRVHVSLLSRLMNRAGELVLSRNQLRPLMERMGREDSQASAMMQNLDMVTSDIQETIMQLRMQPVSGLFEKYKRVIRDLTRQLGKKVEYSIRGGSVEVDRNILQQLANPVTHLIRNAVDHGIESPEERCRAGKDEIGSISVSVVHQSGHVRVDIQDDGRGMDPEAVLARAREKGLVSGGQALSDKEKLNLIFLAGFSTSDAVSELSGRGVGMDVVKANLERLRGHIEIQAVPGRGSCFSLTIPLTLAIVPSLVVGEGGVRFAIPQINVKEVIYLTGQELPEHVENIAGQEVLRLRDNLYPVLRLRNILNMETYYRDGETGELRPDRRLRIADRRSIPLEQGVGKLKGEPIVPEVLARDTRKGERRRRKPDPAYAVVLKLGSQRFALLVEDLFDIEEVVVEPLSEFLKGLKWFAGAAILGDGQVIMVLDVNGMATGACLAFDTIRAAVESRGPDGAVGEDIDQMDLLVFENSPGEFLALPLDRVARLEPIQTEALHHSGGVTFTRFNDQACRLVDLSDFISLTPCPLDIGDPFGIFLKHCSPPAGIRVSKIVDTLAIDLPLLGDETDPELVQGRVFTGGMMIQVLDAQVLCRKIQQRALADGRPGGGQGDISAPQGVQGEAS
ncbi:MAG: chemotaxis protein CheA [Desulfobacterales bacterium]|nr:chemotaxis protein CheA [Desulfobacterales bacterium]